MSEVILYGAEWCAYCQSLKKFLDSSSVEYVYKDVDDSKTIVDEMLSLTDQNYLIPTLVVDGKPFQNPAHKDVAKMLKLNIKTSERG
jgi:thioredoxin reductase (NADPH)